MSHSLHHLQYSDSRAKILSRNIQNRVRRFFKILKVFRKILARNSFVFRGARNWRTKWKIALALYSYAKAHTLYMEAGPQSRQIATYQPGNLSSKKVMEVRLFPADSGSIQYSGHVQQNGVEVASRRWQTPRNN